MNQPPEIRLNSEVFRRGRATHNLSIRALGRITDIRVASLLALEDGRPCERLTVGALLKLAEALSVDPASLLERGDQPRPAQPDDIQVEAVLAQVGKAVNRDDIAWALKWPLERVNEALLALEQRLQGTGQRLRRCKFGWYGLAAAGDVLDQEAASAIDRATFSEYGLRREHAQVLLRIAKGQKLRGSHTRGRGTHTMGRGYGGGRNPVGELLRAQIIGLGDSGVALCPDVAFSLCVEGVELAPPRPLRPQDRNPRAGYSVKRYAGRAG